MTAPHTHVLWHASDAQSVAARIAIAGDFLPAGNLQFPTPSGWRKMAQRLSAQFDDVDASFINLECALDASHLTARPLNGLGEIVTAPSSSLDYLETIRCRAIGSPIISPTISAMQASNAPGRLFQNTE